MAEPAKRHATYQDVLDAPPDKVAEVLDGVLYVQPRPRIPHQSVSLRLSAGLDGPFGRGHGGPGGWLFVPEPEIHLGEDILVPDVAGYRRSRLPTFPDAPYLTLAPDWVCELLSPATASRDRGIKLRIYAASGVEFAWLVDPAARTLESYRREGSYWLLLGAFAGEEPVRVEPFDALPLAVEELFVDLEAP